MNNRPTYPDTNLRFKSFTTKELLIKWANSKKGTDYIVSICIDEVTKEWVLFYIEE